MQLRRNTPRLRANTGAVCRRLPLAHPHGFQSSVLATRETRELILYGTVVHVAAANACLLGECMPAPGPTMHGMESRRPSSSPRKYAAANCFILLAHRITGSGESTTHQSCRPRPSTTDVVRPHTMVRDRRRGRTEHTHTAETPALARALYMIWQI